MTMPAWIAARLPKEGELRVLVRMCAVLRCIFSRGVVLMCTEEAEAEDLFRGLLWHREPILAA